EDDQALFPPYQGPPHIKTATVEKYPELAEKLNELGGIISEEEMSEMNYQFNVEWQDPSIVAKDYLKEKNLL
ncbi:glycine betaine ABC transporter substrate-binding protein, partial [Enterococcus faecalis]|uniref:glycine betaine ABC transporter substrate-binding protein n=1 Tax=Enterococcus faecalis TaxID=1351 RepID=UPI0031CD96B8